MRTVCMSLFVAALAGTASAQLAGVNGLHMVYRNGFDNWTSTITTVNNGLAGVSLSENIPADSVGQNQMFSNRHFAFLSADSGASSYTYDGTSSFSISYRHRMTNSTTPTLPGGNNNTMEGGLWFLQGGESHPFDDGGIFTISNRTVFVGGMGADFSLIAEGNGSNPSFPPFTTPGGWYSVRMDYWAPGMLDAGAHYQVTFSDETTGHSVTTPLRGWDAGSSFPNGLIAGTVIGFRWQDAPVQGVSNNFFGEYSNIVIGAVVPTPASASLLALGGLVALRRRR